MKIAKMLGYDSVSDLERAIDYGEVDNTENYYHFDYIDQEYIHTDYFDEYAKENGYISEDDALDHAVSNGEALATRFVNDRIKEFIEYWDNWQCEHIDRKVDSEGMARSENSKALVSLNAVDTLEEKFHTILSDLE